MPRWIWSGGPQLSLERVRARVSAYVYGTILVLGSVAAASSEAVEDGQAVVLVLVTTATTYLAHVLAHAVGGSVAASEGHAAGVGHLREELRDATPILTSGSGPALLLLLGALGVLPVTLAQVLAAAVLVVRLGLLPVQIRWVSGRSASPSALWSGVGLAALSAVIVAAKVLLGH